MKCVHNANQAILCFLNHLADFLLHNFNHQITKTLYLCFSVYFKQTRTMWSGRRIYPRRQRTGILHEEDKGQEGQIGLMFTLLWPVLNKCELWHCFITSILFSLPLLYIHSVCFWLFCLLLITTQLWHKIFKGIVFVNITWNLSSATVVSSCVIAQDA